MNRPYSTLQGQAAGGFGKNHPRTAAVFLPKTLQVEAFHFSAHEIGNDCSHKIIKDMKTNDPTVRKRMKWIGMILLAVVAALGFSYLYTRGVSPVWAAVAIVCFPGFFRFIYKIACIVMAALILFAILSFLVF